MSKKIMPLMPKATAVWLLDNTGLTFDQIADFCGLHPLEIQAMADGDINIGIAGVSPITSGELSREEITRCEKTKNAKLKMLKTDLPKPRARSKGPRYTPVAKRAEKPNAIAFLISQYPDLADVQVARLVGSTKPTVASIRDRSHANISNISPTDPVSIGLCTAEDLEKQLGRASRRIEREKKAAAAEAATMVAAEPQETSVDTAPAAAVEPAVPAEEVKTEDDTDGNAETSLPNAVKQG